MVTLIILFEAIGLNGDTVPASIPGNLKQLNEDKKFKINKLGSDTIHSVHLVHGT